MFNITVVAVAFFGGWMVNRVFVLLDRLEEDMKLVCRSSLSQC